MKKGFALDDDRLKRLGGGNYFDELLQYDTFIVSLIDGMKSSHFDLYYLYSNTSLPETAAKR